MLQEEIIRIILDEAIYIHRTTGSGMLESVYKTCIAYRLRKRGSFVEIEQRKYNTKFTKWIRRQAYKIKNYESSS